MLSITKDCIEGTKIKKLGHILVRIWSAQGEANTSVLYHNVTLGEGSQYLSHYYMLDFVPYMFYK